MADRMKRLFWRLSRWVIVFALGVAVGFYARDRQQHERLLDAQREMERVGLEAIERAQRAGGEFADGARAAAESTKAAFRQLIEEFER